MNRKVDLTNVHESMFQCVHENRGHKEGCLIPKAVVSGFQPFLHRDPL